MINGKPTKGTKAHKSTTPKKTTGKTTSKAVPKRKTKPKATPKRNTVKKSIKKRSKQISQKKAETGSRSPLITLVSILFWCTLFSVMGYLLFVKKINGHTPYHRIARLFQQDDIQLKMGPKATPVTTQRITSVLPIKTAIPPQNISPKNISVKSTLRALPHPTTVTNQEKADLNALLKNKIE